MHPVNKGERKRIRFFKGMRRLRQDIEEHSAYPTSYGGLPNTSCPCQSSDSRRGRGRTFARFADYPKVCSCAMCGNPRHKGWGGPELLTLQERRLLDRDNAALATLEGLGDGLAE